LSNGFRPRVIRAGPAPRYKPTRLVTGLNASSRRPLASSMLVLVSLMVSPEIFAGAYPPVASKPRMPVPQNVRRAPPTTLTSRLNALSRSDTEFRVGIYAPTQG